MIMELMRKLKLLKINVLPEKKLIAVQIKSGNSYFKELTPNSIIYRGKRKHYDYLVESFFTGDNRFV